MIKLLFNEKVLEWINKHKITFIIIILTLGNIYQYISADKERSSLREEIKQERLKLDTANKNSLEFERSRSHTLEQLLNDILRMYSKTDNKNTKDSI